MASQTMDCLESALISSLLALGFDHSLVEQRKKMMNKSFFTRMEQKFGNQILYFLLSFIDSSKSAKVFRDCWPTLEKKQEAQFRSIAQKWFKELRQNEECYPKLSEVASISAVNSSHPRFKETVLILTCLAFHSSKTRSPKSLLFCPRLSPIDDKNYSSFDVLHHTKLYHCHNYVRFSKIRNTNLHTLQEKAKEMTDYYEKLSSNIHLLEEECSKDPLIIKYPASIENVEEELIQLAIDKNNEVKSLWLSLNSYQEKEKKAWAMISALTNSTSGGITTLDGKNYSTPLFNTCWNRQDISSRPLMTNKNLDLVSLFHHFSSALKIFIEKAKNECKVIPKDPPKEAMQRLYSIEGSMKEVKVQLEDALLPLFDSVASLRHKVDENNHHFNLNKTTQEFTFCSPLQNCFSKTGKTPQSDISGSNLFDLKSGDMQIQTPTGVRNLNGRVAGKLSKKLINEAIQNRNASRPMNNSQSPFIPLNDKTAVDESPFLSPKISSCTSPMQSSFNKILDSTKKFLNYHETSSLSTSSFATPIQRVNSVNISSCNDSIVSEHTLLASEGEEEELKGMIERMALLEESSINKSPHMAKILSEISTSQEKKKSQFLSFVHEKKKKKVQLKKGPDKESKIASKVSSTPMPCKKEENSITIDNFSALLSSLESKIDLFDFNVDNSPKELSGSTYSEDELFMNSKDFENLIDKPARKSLLPKNSVFGTLTEAVLGDEVDPSIVFDKNFDEEIRRESINKRESLSSLPGQTYIGSKKRFSDYNWRLSGETSLLQDISGSCILESSFDSD